MEYVGDTYQFTYGPPNTSQAFAFGAGVVFGGLMLIAFAQLIQVQRT